MNFLRNFENNPKNYVLIATLDAGAQFEGNLGEILALGAEISPYTGLREKLFFFKFPSCQHTIDKL